MNATTNTELAAVQTAQAPAFNTSSAALMMDMQALERIEKFANIMATARVSVPEHFRGKPGDCMAVVMQAVTWGMNPFSVAQKTHLSQSGALGYEAQLISAVVTGSNAVDGDPEYEFIGDWNRILGKVEERKSEKGGKYYVATYTKADEQGLGVICRLRLRGEKEPREMRVMMTQCYPRFSTQWATDPKMQITYVAIRKWARLHKPGLILGVYTPDEIEDFKPPLDMGIAEVLDARPELDAETLIKEGWGKAEKGMAEFGPWFNGMPKLADGKQREILAPHRSDMLAKAKQVDEARTVEQPAANAAPATAETGEVTAAQVLTKINEAKNEDALYVAADWINAITDNTEVAKLNARFDERLAELRG
jgi:RecT family